MDTWINVQQRLSKNEAPTRTGEIHFFSQKVYCSACNGLFMRNVYKVKGEQNGMRAYLQCKGAKKYRSCCNRKAIRLDMLEGAIISEINSKVHEFYNQNSLEQQYNNQSNIKSRYPDRIKALELEKMKLERKVKDQSIYYKDLYENKINNTISEQEFLILKETYLQAIEDAKERNRVIEEELKLLKIKVNKEDNIINTFKKYKKINKLNRIIVDEFIDKIYIGKFNEETKERDIVIEWNIEELAQ